MILKFIQRFLPHIVAIVALSVLIVVSGLLWMEKSSRFPLPQIGAYFGTVSGVALAGGNDVFPLYIERTSSESKFLIAVIRQGWEPLVVELTAQDEGHGDSVLPVVLSGPGGRIKLRGSRIGPTELRGIATDLLTGANGQWELSFIPGRGATWVDPSEGDVASWLKMKEELIDIDAQKNAIRNKLPELDKEIEKLTTFISDKVRLKALADEKYKIVQEDLAVADKALKGLQSQARALEEKLQLAQRVTPMGRIVSLSRESLEREGRWIDSMYRTTSKDNSPELEEAVLKGEEILKAKAAIDEERRLIMALRDRQGDGR